MTICANNSYVLYILAGTLQATRALVVMGLLLGIGSLICFLLRLCSMKDKLILNRVAAGLAIAAGKLNHNNLSLRTILFF